MSNTRVVRQGKHHRGAFVLFEGRRYYCEELNGLIGHKLQILRYPGIYQVLNAIRPEGKGVCQLRTRSATKRISNDVVDEYLRSLKENHLINRQASIAPVSLRRVRQ